MKSTVLFLSAMLASAAVCAAEAPAKAAEPAGEYRYGMGLDVAEVVSIQEVPHGRCEPVDAKMTYRDSRGQLHTVSYVKQEAGCY